jgi:hypothetical protein
MVIVSTFSLPAAGAISFGCSKAQSEASRFLSRAKTGKNLEQEYLARGMYSTAFRMFQGAVNDYYLWNSAVKKSPKCFSATYVRTNKAQLATVSVNYTMASRYGSDIAARNNYGSADPCFKFLGEDQAYLKCSMDQY